MDGIELPRLYIAENRKDAEIAVEKGLPFVRWTQGKDKLISMLLMPALRKLFPYINWSKLPNIPRVSSKIVHCPGRKVDPIEIDEDYHPDTSHANGGSITPSMDTETVVPIADEERDFSNGPVSSTVEYDLAAYVGDLSSYVNLDVLQEFKLMPKFIGDIMDCIKTNMVSGTMWSEGYNKKRGATIGNYDRSGQLRNLIIVDVSASIPVGISATMLTLVDTLRTQVHADLIITGGKSRFYAYEDELPDPQVIRNTIPRSNEGVEFAGILKDHILGNHYGHVISFGDNDNPAIALKYERGQHEKMPGMAGTKVEHVHHYHTNLRTQTGYAAWCHQLQMKPMVSYDTSWCKVID